MAKKVLLAVVCWLALSEAEETKTVNVSITDSQSAESAPRLYQNVPVGVYASSVPYGSYSFHVPIVQHAAASQSAPKTVLHNLNSFKDSYGKFVQVPQAAYKFPQQYIQLQELPAHLSQPLVAAAPSFQYKQTAPHFFFGPQQYKVPLSQQVATPTPITKYSGFPQPLVYAQHIRNFAPSSGFYTQGHNFPTTQQQSSSNKDVYTNTPTYQRVQGISQGQVLSEKNKDSENKQQVEKENKQIQAAPAQTSVTAIVNGKKTVLTLETKPPLPLLNLDLLEPLTFANPLVPQVQHFLPRINQATYHTLPSFNANEEKKYQKEIVVQKSKSYDSGPIKGKPQTIAPKKKTQTKSRPQSNTSKPKITVNGSPDGKEFSYEINSPDHKETYNEQVVSYNKETNMKPVEYTYNKQITKEPVHYSFVHSSKEPLHIKHVEYESDPQNPKQLIYKFSPEKEDQNDEVQQPQVDSEESGESDESEEDGSPSHEHHGDHEGPRHPQHSHQQHSQHQETPTYSHHSDSGHHEIPRHAYHPEHHKESPRNSQQHHEHQSRHSNSPSYSHDHISHQSSKPRHPQSHSEHGHHRESPKYSNSHNEHRSHHIESPRQHEEPPRQTNHNVGHHNSPKQSHHSGHSGHQSPRQSHHLKPEHREEYHHAPNHESHHPIVYGTPHYHSQPLTVTVQNAFQPITHEYEEHINILPTHKPHNAAIKVDPNQHVQHGPSTPYQNAQSPPASQKFVPQEYHNHHHPPHSSPSPQIHEKSKHIIIKEKDESPNEMHTHIEQLMAQMIEQDENNEEDFEKAYKESAFGFPAYEQTADHEKDIYDPSLYGEQSYTEFKADQTPFQQYEEEGDDFPKSARLTYKDESDKEKEKYYLDYAVSKPESLVDRYKKKEDYYKTYKKYKPEKLFVHENNKKEKQKEKYITAPSHPFVYPAPAAIPKQQQYFARYKVVPKRYEYDYSKGAPSDSDAFASRPYHKHKTFFVEPQYQYGFEPISAPLVLDSELAVMASNDSPESEKPGTRKKIYKENWYIKKTSSTAGTPS